MLGEKHAKIGGKMATWNDIKAWFTAQEINFIDNGDWIETGFFFASQNRSQSLRIGYQPAPDGTQLIWLMSPIAAFDPKKVEALLTAACQGVGGVALANNEDGKFFILQSTVPIADLDASEIQWHATSLTGFADDLEEAIFKTDIA